MTDATSVSSGLHRCAIVASVCVSVGLLTGAMVTSSGGTSFGQLHRITADVTAVAIAILGGWLVRTQMRRWGWALLAILAADCALGALAEGASAAIYHALLAQTLFAVTKAAAFVTSAAWRAEPDLVEDHGWPSLGSLGKITPVMVLGQIALGAAFRHKAMGVLGHLFGAMILVLLILCVCIFVMQQFPTHRTLRPAANLLMAIAFTQIFLGIAAFTARTITSKITPAVIAVTAAHAYVGAWTLTAAVLLSMQIRRNVFKRISSEDEESSQ